VVGRKIPCAFCTPRGFATCNSQKKKDEKSPGANPNKTIQIPTEKRSLQNKPDAEKTALLFGSNRKKLKFSAG